MFTEQIITIGDTAELVLTQELLEKIGVGAGDKIEVAIEDRALIVRSLNGAGKKDEQERDKMMEALMERRSKLFQRLAEGAK